MEDEVTTAPAELTVPELNGQEERDGLSDRGRAAGGMTSDYSDLGNAEMLVHMHGRDIQCVAGKRWFVWDGTRYRPDDTNEIVRRAKKTVQFMLQAAVALGEDVDNRKKMISHALASQESHAIRNMITLAGSEEKIAVRQSSFDADPYALNLPNGTLDLRTFEVRPHSRRDRITRITSAGYGGPLLTALWKEFVEGLFPDPAVREFVQTAVGYSLLGNPREDCMFFLYGPPRCGKTTFLEAVRQTLGDYASTFKFELLLASEYGAQSGAANPDLMSLEGKRFVTSAETKQGRRLDEGKLKWITGMDTIRGRALYQDEREFAPTHTLWIAANDAPRAKSDDEGLWTRVHRIPAGVEQRVDPDPGVRERILEPGACEQAILAWAIEGLRRYWDRRLVVPDGVRRSTREWRSESDPLEEAFDEVFETDPTFTCTPQAAWDAYNDWARDNADQRDRIRSKVSFGKRLHDRGFKRDGTGQSRDPWVGFRSRFLSDG